MAARSGLEHAFADIDAGALERPRALSLVCVSRRRETADVVTFVFAEADGNPLRHTPGQAVTLALPVDGEQLHRSFTISESSPEGETIALTVKAQTRGHASAWLHAQCGVGTALEARGPHGRFTLGLRDSLREDRGIAFVSAGSGVTPMIAMLRALAADAPDTDVVWIHAARTPADALFGEAVASLQKAMPRLVAAIVVSQPMPGWFGFTGRVSRRLLSVMAPDLARRDVFVCGPGGFIDTVRLIHAAEGGDAARFHTERFDTGSSHAAPSHAGQSASKTQSGAAAGAGARATLGQKEFNVGPGETLLQAALRQGVVIPCGCCRGMCGTCRVKLEAGEVRMVHDGGISDREEAQGFILACSSRPVGDVRLSF